MVSIRHNNRSIMQSSRSSCVAEGWYCTFDIKCMVQGGFSATRSPDALWQAVSQRVHPAAVHIKGKCWVFALCMLFCWLERIRHDYSLWQWSRCCWLLTKSIGTTQHWSALLIPYEHWWYLLILNEHWSLVLLVTNCWHHFILISGCIGTTASLHHQHDWLALIILYWHWSALLIFCEHWWYLLILCEHWHCWWPTANIISCSSLVELVQLLFWLHHQHWLALLILYWYWWYLLILY